MSTLVGKAFLPHVAQGLLTLTILEVNRREQNLPVDEDFPFVFKLTLDWILILQHCWEQRGTSAESRPPLLWAQIFWFFSRWSLSTRVGRCQTHAKEPVKHGWRSPWCLSHCRHRLCCLPVSFFFSVKNGYLFSMRKSQYRWHPGRMEVTTFRCRQCWDNN